MPNPLYIIYAYLAFVSVFAVGITAWDKHAAMRGYSRVPERSLFIISAIGGSVAMYITMKIIRHKTNHKSFMIGIPLIIALQVIVVLAILIKRGVLGKIPLPF